MDAVQGRTKLPSGRLSDRRRAAAPAEDLSPAVTLTVMRARQKTRRDRAFSSSANAGKRTGKSCSSSISHRRKVMPDTRSCTAPPAVEQARTLDIAALWPAMTVCSAMAARCWCRSAST